MSEQDKRAVISLEFEKKFIIGAVPDDLDDAIDMKNAMQANGQWLIARATVNLDHAR